VQLVGSLAYVADGLEGLQIIDVSTPSAPALVGACDLPGSARDVDVVGSLAYVATYYHPLRDEGDFGYKYCLQVVDVSLPDAPTLVGSYDDMLGHARAVDVVGSLAYVASSYNGLQILALDTVGFDLNADSDTGFQDDDNVTDETDLVFMVSRSRLTYVRKYRDGVPMAGDFTRGEVYYYDQTPGVYDYAVELMDLAGNVYGMSDELTTTIYEKLGDATFEGLVDGADLALWQQHYDPLGANDNTFAMGDFNSDGRIDGADLALWQANYDPVGLGDGLSSSDVPGTAAIDSAEGREASSSTSAVQDTPLFAPTASAHGIHNTPGHAEQARATTPHPLATMSVTGDLDPLRVREDRKELLVARIVHPTRNNTRSDDGSVFQIAFVSPLDVLY